MRIFLRFNEREFYQALYALYRKATRQYRAGADNQMECAALAHELCRFLQQVNTTDWPNRYHFQLQNTLVHYRHQCLRYGSH